MRIGVTFYYVGDMELGREAYSRLLDATPEYSGDQWTQFRVQEAAFALHHDPSLASPVSGHPSKCGAVVSFYVPDMEPVLERALEAGFLLQGKVTAQPFGRVANLQDPWGNALSIVQPA